MATQIHSLSAAALSDLVRARRSVRAFRSDPVPREEMEVLLADAVWAPSPHNSQPWRFTVLSDPGDRERLGRAMAQRLANELVEDGVDMAVIGRQTARSQARIAGAPVALLLSLEDDGLVHYADGRRDALEWQMAVQSVGAALQTLFLLAAARGIGSCWMAAPMYCPEVVRATLDLPESYAPQALVLLGYPADGGKLRPRRPFDQVVEFR